MKYMGGNPLIEAKTDTAKAIATVKNNGTLSGTQGYKWNGTAYIREHTQVSSPKPARSLPLLCELGHPRYSTGALNFEHEQAKYNRNNHKKPAHKP